MKKTLKIFLYLILTIAYVAFITLAVRPLLVQYLNITSGTANLVIAGFVIAYAIFHRRFIRLRI